jgi:hypothetical protein
MLANYVLHLHETIQIEKMKKKKFLKLRMQKTMGVMKYITVYLHRGASWYNRVEKWNKTQHRKVLLSYTIEQCIYYVLCVFFFALSHFFPVNFKC